MQQTGIVKWFSRPKGFGFVVSEAGEDVFVPHDALRAAGITELKVGERLFFVVSFLMARFTIWRKTRNARCAFIWRRRPDGMPGAGADACWRRR